MTLGIVASTVLSRFYARAPDEPCRISLVMAFLASLVFVGNQHVCSPYGMLLNHSTSGALNRGYWQKCKDSVLLRISMFLRA